jgi:hypothetical protein
MNKLQNEIDEEIDEGSWRITRKFMQEIEREIGRPLPVAIMLISRDLATKWGQYVRTN